MIRSDAVSAAETRAPRPSAPAAADGHRRSSAQASSNPKLARRPSREDAAGSPSTRGARRSCPRPRQLALDVKVAEHDGTRPARAGGAPRSRESRPRGSRASSSTLVARSVRSKDSAIANRRARGIAENSHHAALRAGEAPPRPVLQIAPVDEIAVRGPDRAAHPSSSSRPSSATTSNALPVCAARSGSRDSLRDSGSPSRRRGSGGASRSRRDGGLARAPARRSRG